MPLLPGTPDIDTRVNVGVEFGPSRMRIEGTVFGDNFLNLEVFLLCYRSQHTALLSDGRTTGGRNTGPIARLARIGSDMVFLDRFDRELKLDQKGELEKDYTTSPVTLRD